MLITYSASSRTFHLAAADVSYVIGLHDKGFPMNLYWGARLTSADLGYLWEDCPLGASFDPQANRYPMEYPTGAWGDHRIPACRIQGAYGDVVTQFLYVSHEILPGKPSLPGLPATYVEDPSEAETLLLNLEDALTGAKVQLSYTIFAATGAIARSVRFENASQEPMRLVEAASASVDLFGTDWELLHLWGGWAIERTPQRLPIPRGETGISSRRGASGHEHNPFAALLRPETTESQGEVYGFSLVYSGSFAIRAGANAYESTRLTLGLNPADFTWLLEPGETFVTPEAVLVYGAQGLNSMSQKFHSLYRSRLCRGVWRDTPRPVLVNNWEATYFGFDEDKLMAIVDRAAEMGIELFVLDDGWFGVRNTDNCSLGDWVVNKKKLPNGLEGLSKKVHAKGLKFGLWFEPEMVSPDSDLYRAHPDWCLHVPGRERTECRQQLILDLSREDVCRYIVDAVSAILSTCGIDYVKWDMNRNFTEAGSALLPPQRQREVSHRYMLGLYRVLEEITSRFPQVLFESCSGGGGRFDPGMLYYMPQTWTSDDTDAIERLKLQYGTSIVYPASSMGAHVSAVPNHQTGRTTSMQTRCDVALGGNYGYELDLSKLSAEDVATAKASIALVKEIRGIVQQGTFTRLVSPFAGNSAAWQFLAPDGSEVVACYFSVLSSPNRSVIRLRLQGLEPQRRYRDLATGRVYDGSVLMGAGLIVPAMQDFSSYVARLRAE